jgi:DNA (cytosine-5)-methyltransferase 1
VLDLFCGAGGASMGLHRAGFEVVGVDIRPQPRYPFEFHQADALTFDLSGVDFVWTSPPCQKYKTGLNGSNLKRGRTLDHPDLIPQTRARLVASGLPYIIENVTDAPLLNPVRLCGSSFRRELKRPLRRHRHFESNVPLLTPPCDHSWQTEKLYHTNFRPGGRIIKSPVVQVYGNSGGREFWADAMGIDWMKAGELTQAVPPVFAEVLGRQVYDYLDARAEAAA